MPDFRSLGVITRILLAANAAGIVAAALRSEQPREILDRFARIAASLEPALFATLVLLYLLNGQLSRLPYAAGLAVVLALCAIIAALLAGFSSLFAPVSPDASLWNASYALLLAIAFAGYFELRERAFSPALAEARLQALQSRIRPHFLFNCINAVLLLVRRDPQRAEAALEDMADLFRAVMSDSRELVPLADEISLTERYLQLEHLRLGERLVVRWNVEPEVTSALVPPMLLQPLVENAVYHGVEPGIEPGMVEIGAGRDGDSVVLTLSNPYHPDHQHRQGNRMALGNIEERLALHFDLEASLDAKAHGERFRITIRVPLRRAPA